MIPLFIVYKFAQYATLMHLHIRQGYLNSIQNFVYTIIVHFFEFIVL